MLKAIIASYLSFSLFSRKFESGQNNTDAVINLNNCKISYGSNILISSKGTSEWGNSGTNGGNVTLNASKQTLNGIMCVEKCWKQK